MDPEVLPIQNAQVALQSSSLVPPICLPPGYRYVPTEGRWDNTRVFPKWRARYPDPPDLVGVTRIYEKYVAGHVPHERVAGPGVKGDGGGRTDIKSRWRANHEHTPQALALLVDRVTSQTFCSPI